MENNFKNLNYKLINSSLKEHHEVCVSFIYNGKSVKRFIYIKDKKNAKGIYYINEAKKKINEEINNGKLLEYAKKYIENKDKKDHRKGILIFFIIFMSATALALAGLFTWKYLAGSEDTPQTYTVSAVIANSDIAVGYSLEYKDKVEKGKDYQTTIKLNKSSEAVNECFLPAERKLGEKVAVAVKINDSDCDNFDYTPHIDIERKGPIEAELSISNTVVTGNITISIMLIPQKAPVIVFLVEFPSGIGTIDPLNVERYKKYEGTITLTDKSTELDLDLEKFKITIAPSKLLTRNEDYKIIQNTSEKYKYTLTINENIIDNQVKISAQLKS